MRKSALLFFMLVGGLAVGAVTGASLARAEAGEETGDVPVPNKDVPAGVLATATRFSEGLDLERVVLADEDGVQVYELHFKKGARSVEIQTTTKGDLFSVEERVAAADVPELVSARAAKLFPRTAKLQFERNIAVVYEVAAKDAHGKETEYLVNQAGAAFQEIAPGIREEK